MDLLQFTRSRRGGELIGIVVLAAGVTLAAALLTYHPNDSSAFYTSTNTTIANAIGYYGATIAWIFVGFFGFASLLFPAALLIIGWNRFWAKELEYAHTKLIGFVVLALAFLLLSFFGPDELQSSSSIGGLMRQRWFLEGAEAAGQQV